MQMIAPFSTVFSMLSNITDPKNSFNGLLYQGISACKMAPDKTK